MGIAQDAFSEAAGQAANAVQTTGESVSSKLRTMGDKGKQGQTDKVLDQMAGQGPSDVGKMTQPESSEISGQQPTEEGATRTDMGVKLNEYATKAQSYAEEKFPSEKQHDVILRLKHVLHQVQEHPDFQQAIDTLITLVSTWSNRLSEVSATTKEAVAKATGVSGDQGEGMPDWNVISQEAKAVLEDWAQGEPLDPIIDCLQTSATDIKNDESLRNYYDQVKSYMTRLLKEPGYVDNDQSTEEGCMLLQRGKELMTGKYHGQWSQLVRKTKKWTRHVANDPIVKEIRACFEKIHRDLWFDSEGNVSLKPQLLDDMRLTLLPAALEQIKVVPIPRIEYSDPTVDVVLENIVLSGDALLPNIVEMKVKKKQPWIV